MATIATRLSNTGTLLVNGGFDENTSIAPSNFRTTSNTVFSNALDEVSLAAGSVSFNGTNQFLNINNTSLSNFSTNNFTVEGWVWLDSTIITTRIDGAKTIAIFAGNTIGFTLNIMGNASRPGIGFEIYQASPSIYIFNNAAPFTLNEWNHFAFVRSGTTFYGFVNGTRYTIGTSSSVFGGAGDIQICGDTAPSSYQSFLKGYLSNLCVNKGTALYTTNFTPPTGILPAVANTSLLLNVTDSTNFIKDNGPNKFTVTNNNSATFNTNGPFNQGVTTIKQRQVTDGTLEVYSNFDEFTGAPVVDDSLVLWLDAAQTTSYPGTGTTWTDLSGKGNNGTLTSGPTYNASNGGSIVFDGTNDYVTASNAVRIGGKNISCTVDIAFYLPSGGGGWLVTNERESNNNGQGWYWCDNTQLYFSQHSRGFPPYEYKCTASGTGFSNIRINDWNIVSFSVNVATTTMSCNFMINGYSETITNNSLVFDGTESTTDDNIDIGRFRNYVYGTTYTNVRVASLRIHNRALATDEMTTNFNALRRRYGI
jgi:hypothetical protein